MLTSEKQQLLVDGEGQREATHADGIKPGKMAGYPRLDPWLQLAPGLRPARS